jgi:tetratricopeptide (TPR) repeat protein
VWFYAGKLLWPANLTFSYPRWTISPSAPLAYGWPLATAALGVVIWRARRWAGRSLEVAALFFAVTLSPVLGFIMLYTFVYSFVADHYQYLACLGPLALAAAGIELGLGRLTMRTALFRLLCRAALPVVLGVLTWRQCGMYTDEETLWRATLERNPRSWMAYDNLGVTLLEKGHLEEALAQYRKALEINSADKDVHNNLGAALFKKGEVDQAIAQYQMALEINPAAADVRNNLGAALLKKGDLDQAIVQYQKALEINPDYPEARYNLGNALVKHGNLDAALAQYRQALLLKPDYPKASYNLGAALLLKGDFDGAMACFQKTTPLSRDPLARWGGLGNGFFQSGDWDLAIACYRQALTIAPRSADAYANLGLAFLQKGQIREALESWQHSIEINPNQPSALNSLAWLLATTADASLRDGAKAVALASQASQLTGGGNPAILRTLAAAYAEEGGYSLASVTARRALGLAVEQKNDALAAALRREIQLYEADKPVREGTTEGSAPTGRVAPP